MHDVEWVRGHGRFLYKVLFTLPENVLQQLGISKQLIISPKYYVHTKKS